MKVEAKSGEEKQIRLSVFTIRARKWTGISASSISWWWVPRQHSLCLGVSLSEDAEMTMPKLITAFRSGEVVGDVRIAG